MAIFILGEFGFLLTTIALVFLILILIPNYCFPTSFILLVSSASSFSFPANNAVSSAYLRLHSHVDTVHVDNMSDNLLRVSIEKSGRCYTSLSNSPLYSYFI